MDMSQLLIAIIVSIFLYFRLRGKLQTQAQEIDSLKAELNALKGSDLKPSPTKVETIQKPVQAPLQESKVAAYFAAQAAPQTSTSVSAPIPPKPSPPIEKPAQPVTEPVKPVLPQEPIKPALFTKPPQPEEPPKRLIRDSALWKQIENQFARNMTGILGVLAIVLGVIFLGVYAAIQLDPAGRFGMVCLFSIALYALYFFLNKKDFAKNLSLWIRSASGVIFLVGCIGSVGIDAMKWVTDPKMALALLSLGLVTNLIFGLLNGGQVFASIHVLLSLLALSVVPASEVTFAMATLVAVAGICMSSKEKLWDRHLVATILGFSALHFYWLYLSKEASQEFPVRPLFAIISCLFIGVVAIISHYRKAYQSVPDKTGPLFTHILTWTTLGLNLYAHSQGSPLSSVFIGLAAVATFALSAKARSMQINWLYVCDRLASLFLMLLGIISLHKFNLSVLEISLLAAAASTLFVRISLLSFDKTIFTVSLITSLLAYTFTGLHFANLILSHSEVSENFIYMLTLSFLCLAFVFPTLKKAAQENQVGFEIEARSQKQFVTFLEFPLTLHGFLGFLFVTQTAYSDWLKIIPFAILIYQLVLRQKLQNFILDLFVFIGIGLSTLLLIPQILDASNAVLVSVIYLAEILVLGIISGWFSRSETLKQKITWPGVSLVWLALTLASYIFTYRISPILPGICWLIISLICTEVSRITKFSQLSEKHERTDVFIQLFGLLSLLLFFVRFILVDASNEALAFESIRVRYFSEILSLGATAYWYIFSSQSRSNRLQQEINYLLELFILAAGFYALHEIDNSKHPVLWGLASLLSFDAGKRFEKSNRLLVYSYFFYFGALFNVAFLSTTIATPSSLFLDQAWVMGLTAVFISTIFMVIAHRQKEFIRTSQLNLPSAVRWLQGPKNLFENAEVKALLYPLFIAVAFFLFWSFDKTILSLLWVVECFVLFLISIVMREPQFRIVSMTGIGLIFLRIIFYDLTGRDFFIKAIVFISVGVILVAMNTIYNKYKHRYESKQ